MVLIHEKITALLERRRLKKRDLARALGVSPQTATDICKGRSAITLPHLRNLVAFFEVRADFWLDDERILPESADRVGHGPATAPPTALLQVSDPERMLQAVRTFLGNHRSEFLTAFPDLSEPELRYLGLAESDSRNAGHEVPADARIQRGEPEPGARRGGLAGTGEA
ncbi:MAG: helix-turn-helix domain-containing protein [Planctomycetes bacterium]|nr:helix-turn-helix domain-containing protein [Planctomycetota bacterium]